jgi:hypothetical protein
LLASASRRKCELVTNRFTRYSGSSTWVVTTNHSVRSGARTDLQRWTSRNRSFASVQGGVAVARGSGSRSGLGRVGSRRLHDCRHVRPSNIPVGNVLHVTARAAAGSAKDTDKTDARIMCSWCGFCSERFMAITSRWSLRRSLSIAVLGVIAIQDPTSRMPCAGALHAAAVAAAQAPERKTPDGEWCQRETPQMNAKAHACRCHQHDCEDPDPTHVSAHIDSHCLNYCTVSQCRCATQDCP